MHGLLQNNEPCILVCHLDIARIILFNSSVTGCIASDNGDTLQNLLPSLYLAISCTLPHQLFNGLLEAYDSSGLQLLANCSTAHSFQARI